MTRNSTFSNIDSRTVEGFGDEWAKFDQSSLPEDELLAMFDLYFRVFPWDLLPDNAEGLDLGCGTGRWAKFVAPRVGKLHCIDASEVALRIAQRNLVGKSNCDFHLAPVSSIPLLDDSMDFAYSLGVLHHVPDTLEAIESIVSKLKPGAPLLLYLYYAFDNRPAWFRLLWRVSDRIRYIISKLPFRLKYWVSSLIACLIYFPLAKFSLLLEKLGHSIEIVPLSAYRHRSFYTMRTDALDRFGTRLEQRFTRREIEDMMRRAGLERIQFSSSLPYWCVVGYKSENYA